MFSVISLDFTFKKSHTHFHTCIQKVQRLNDLPAGTFDSLHFVHVQLVELRKMHKV